MYLEGAALGAGLAAFLYFALPRLNSLDKAKKDEVERVQRMDLSPYTGTMTLAIDEIGVQFRSPNQELKLSWQVTAPTTVGDFVIFQHGGQDTTIIPRRAFASESAAAEFLDQAVSWWHAAQLPHAERLTRYLADRDRACPRCKYNLRGMRGEACPECGESIRLESLVTL